VGEGRQRRLALLLTESEQAAIARAIDKLIFALPAKSTEI
jgi:hypothetical protein